MKTSLFQDFVDFSNTEINNFISEYKANIVPLGPEYNSMTHEESAEHLRLYRMAKKFCIPSNDSANERKSASVKAVFAYDTAGLSRFAIWDVPCERSRYRLNLMRFHLQRTLKRFKIDISDFDLPSGETSLSARGDVSTFAKLKDPAQWRVSPSCFGLFAKICYNSPGLKAAFRQHVAKYGKMRRLDNENGFQCFKRYLKAFVTFENYSRVTTVPKNNDVDRVILCEPLGNMIVQRCIAKAIIKHIETQYGINLLKAQDVHIRALMDEGISTIDLSNASNSNWWCVVQWLLQGTPLLDLLSSSRLQTVKWKDTYHHLNMMSPMGNGFTFEVMTLILLALTRQFDDESLVFGDDIIVKTETATNVITCLEFLGYSVNDTKTFINSNFRESCGGFYNRGYILSFDFWYAEDIVGAITNVNKLFYLQKVDISYRELWMRLVERAPALLLGSFLYYTSWPLGRKIVQVATDYVSLDCNLDLSSHVICHPKYHAKRVKKMDPKAESTALESRMPLKFLTKKSATYGRFDRKTKCFIPWQPLDNVRGFLLAHYLYVGVTAPHIREDRITLSGK